MKNSSVHKKLGKGKEKLSFGKTCQGGSLQTRSITTTRKLERNANSQAPLQIYWIRNSGGRAFNLCHNKPSKWFWYTLKFENLRPGTDRKENASQWNLTELHDIKLNGGGAEIGVYNIKSKWPLKFRVAAHGFW